MKKTIAVAGLNEAPLPVCHVEVDEYVPLRFRSYEGTLGVIYLRLGNFSSSLLEFLLDPSSMTVRGFTLTSFDTVHQPNEIVGLPRATGLPVIDVAAAGDFGGPVGARRIDIARAFSVGLGDDFLEVDLGGFSEAKHVIAGGPAEFYIATSSLVGLRVVGLNQDQISMLRSRRAA